MAVISYDDTSDYLNIEHSWNGVETQDCAICETIYTCDDCDPNFDTKMCEECFIRTRTSVHRY